MSLESNGVDRERSLRKIPTRLRDTNFCTSSARFALSFVGQPNGPKCIQIVQNTTKHEFRVPWGGPGAFVVKNSDVTSWHELLHQFGPFWIECCNATNCPKCTQIVRNTTKHEVRVQWGGSSGLLWKIPTRLHGTKFCTTSARFAPSFVRKPNGTKCAQIVLNTPKHEFRVQWGGSGAFVAKNCDATSWHELLHRFGSFRTECCNATNYSKYTQIVRNASKHEVRVQ